MEKIAIDLDCQEDRKRFMWTDEGSHEIEKGRLKKIDVNLAWRRDRKRLRWIDEGLDEIEIIGEWKRLP